MPLLCKGPRSGPFAQRRTTTALACFYSATLAWNPTAVDSWVQRYAPEIEKRLRWQWLGPRSTGRRVTRRMCRKFPRPIANVKEPKLIDHPCSVPPSTVNRIGVGSDKGFLVGFGRFSEPTSAAEFGHHSSLVSGALGACATRTPSSWDNPAAHGQ